MNIINNYNFGKVVINNKIYTNDVIVFPDRVVSNWWRKDGHSLCIEDIKEVISFKPNVFIMGCGAYGILKVPETFKEELKAAGIIFEEYKTADAVKRYNSLSEKERIVLGLHLTC